MNIASYFATLGFKVTKGEIKKVDDFLGKIEEGLKTAGKEADTTEKATKKVKKSTDEATKAIKQQLTWQEKLNKFKQGELKLTFAIAQNQKQLARNFKQSIDAMVIKPTTAKKLKEQQALYNGLFGAVAPKKMVGATGANQSAWNRQFNQRIQQLTQQSKASRASRQADLEAVFGLPKAQSNPRVAALINERLGYMGGRKNDALADMAAYYRNEEKVAKLKTDAQKKIEESEKRILEARKRGIERRIRNQERLAVWERKQQAMREEWDRRQEIRRREREQRVRQAPRSTRTSPASISRANFLHAGGAAGALARYGVAALPFVGGVYGMASLNKMNQEVISAQLTTQAVTEAAGISGQGPQAFEWLRSQANRIGFNYMDQVESYNNFLSNALGAGVSLQGSQDIYLGFAEYSRAMGISPVRNKLVMNALSQMMGKGTVSMEELKRQMAESMPGTMDVFAQAYAELTGSGLTGQDALSALYEAVPKGKVKSSEILPIVQRILRERAAPKLDVAMRTSQAEQGRFQSMMADTAILASKSGVESGFARLFKSMTVALKEAAPLVESFGRGFNKASKFLSQMILSMQSIQRFFQGRDSWFGDTFFGTEERRNTAFEWLGSIRTLMSEIGDLLTTIYNGWGMLFDLLTSSTAVKAISDMQIGLANVIGAINAAANGDFKRAGEMMQAAFIESVDGSRVYNPMGHKSTLESLKAQTAADRRKAGFPGTLGVFPMSQEEQATRAMRGTGSYGTSSLNNVVVESGAIIVNTQATDGNQLAEELRPHLQQMFRVEQTRTFTEAMLMVPQKE